MAALLHATPAVLAPGEVLLPPAATGIAPNFAAGRPARRVYMSQTMDEALLWADMLLALGRSPWPSGTPSAPPHAEVHVYEVEPSGRVFSKWLPDVEAVEFHAASATVLRHVRLVRPAVPARTC